MKIVNRQEFYKLPEGTLYSEFKPYYFGGLYIKGETLSYNNIPSDFVTEDLIGNIESDNSDEYHDNIVQAVENKTSLKLDFDCAGRDGMYEEDMMYAVYEKDDIAQFILRLTKLL